METQAGGAGVRAQRPGGERAKNGYWVSAGYDKTEIGHHILTIDGIRGRDALGK